LWKANAKGQSVFTIAAVRTAQVASTVPVQCDVAAAHSDILSVWNKQQKVMQNCQEI